MSPILQLFGWSTLAHSAFEANRHLFSPPPLIQPYVPLPSCPHCINPHAPLDGLLALHLRRGDFIEHCPNLGRWSASFNAFNDFPYFLDRWVAPPSEPQDERIAHYVKRCLPNIEQIVEKVDEVRSSRAGRGLKNIYIMTNGEVQWLADLKKALFNMGGWELIATSRDLVLTPEQKYTSHAMDMMVGERAQVLIGNGVRSVMSCARQSDADSITVFKYEF